MQLYYEELRAKFDSSKSTESCFASALMVHVASLPGNLMTIQSYQINNIAPIFLQIIYPSISYSNVSTVFAEFRTVVNIFAYYLPGG